MAANEEDFTLKAISAMMEKMEETSKVQVAAMERLNETATSLLKAVDALPKAEKDGLDELVRKSIEEEAAWETVRDTGKEQEKETVDSWKDELNNLLVFAGLFSAVVTAFTVESYTWLQQDPGDASNALLAQLSLQLSMFRITFTGSPPSSAFANSTAPPLSLSDVQSSFSPVSYAVSVNTLWVLSLTLSLISAFFAIAAQQWLRQLHLPPEMPVRRAVQLLEARKDGLKTWQVPSIIALLPLLLQIAVIFFLVGLFLLLRSLNTTVAIAFGAVVAVGLLAFLTTIFIPLISARCPYKTPLVPTVVIVLQCLSYPLAVLSLPFAASSKIFLKLVMWYTVRNIISLSDWFYRYSIPNFFDETLLPYLKNFGRHMFVDFGRFWLNREYQYICPSDEANLPGNRTFERSSLIQTFLSTSAWHSSRVLQLLNGSEGDTSARGVQDTVVSGLCAFRTGLKWSDLIPPHTFRLDPKMAPYIGKWLSARHHRLLWQYLQQRDWKRNRKVMWDDSRCLFVFHELDTTFPATRPRYAKHLLRICAQQKLSEDCWTSETIPACLVLDLILNRGYVPEEGDADALLAFASNVYGKYRGDLDGRAKHRLFLVSTALALITVNKSGAAHLADITSTVNILVSVLNKEITKENAVSELQRYYRDGSNWSQVYPEFMSPARIMQALCEALSDYAASPLLSPSSERDLTRISPSLREICTGGDPSYAEQSEMQAACRNLDELKIKLEIVPKRKAMVAELAARFSSALARHPNSSAAPTEASLDTGPNKRAPNKASPSDSATRTTQIDTVQGSPIVTDNEQVPPLAADSTNHNDLSHPIGNDAAAGFTASESAQTTPSISDKGKERETPAITLPTPKPREGQKIQDVNASLNGASRSASTQAPSASEVDRAAAEDDAPHDEGPNNMDLGGPGGDVTSIRATGEE